MYLGRSLTEKPKKLKLVKRTKSHIFGSRRTLRDRDKFFSPGAIALQSRMAILLKLSKGFWVGEKSNFGLFHGLPSSPLTHRCLATVRLCNGSRVCVCVYGRKIFSFCLYFAAIIIWRVATRMDEHALGLVDENFVFALSDLYEKPSWDKPRRRRTDRRFPLWFLCC